jgi:hypothetical protein
MDDQRDYAEEADNRHLREDWPEPTDSRPDHDDVWEMLMDDGDVAATDGCYGIEVDGTCEHGYPAWPLYLGLI